MSDKKSVLSSLVIAILDAPFLDNYMPDFIKSYFKGAAEDNFNIKRIDFSLSLKDGLYKKLDLTLTCLDDNTIHIPIYLDSKAASFLADNTTISGSYDALISDQDLAHDSINLGPLSLKFDVSESQEAQENQKDTKAQA